MRHLKTWWLLILALMSGPYVLLYLAGSVWLYERKLLWQWGAVAAVLTFVSWWWAQRLRQRQAPPTRLSAQPDDDWPPLARAAWQQVEAIANRMQEEDLPLDRPESVWTIVREVLEAVAQQFHPRSKRAMLEVPVPHVLRIVELVARDLRVAFSNRVPAGHVLTLHDYQRLRRLAGYWTPLYAVYRVGSFVVNPLAATIREVRDAAAGKLMDASIEEVRRWAIGFAVRKAGFYAIQLYSGHLVLDDVDFDAYHSRQSREDKDRAVRQAERLAEEPLRILVLGQVKAGKSSLINALFGEPRAAVDVVPRTRFIEPYILDREGTPRAIILDTAGYELADMDENPFEPLRGEILNCDLLLVVCSARSAARGADRRLLDELREFFQREPDRLMPPTVAALTHIDQLRPLAEWNPPYNIAEPDRPKARSIRDAAETVAADLALTPAQVIPVCLKPERIYNVEEALIPAILQAVPEAQRVKYLRCLRQFHSEQYWRKLWQQAASSGRLLLQAGTEWLRSRSRGD